MTIGAFESLHLGHQAVINRVKELSMQIGVPSAVLMFEPLPSEFFASTQTTVQRRIYRLSQRIRIMQGLQPDILACLRFCKQLADMHATEFIEEILLGAFKVKHIVFGEDFCFGKGRSGDGTLLKEYGEKHHFSVEQAKTVQVDNERVSSTRVRDVLLHSDFAMAERLLGRPYVMKGRVIAGDGLGKQLGFPTANISYGKHLPPLQGVFGAHLRIAGKTHRAVVNAGVRPTVNKERYQIEVHILQFADNIYGQSVALTPLFKIRDEKHFASLDELKRAIASDVETAEQTFENEAWQK